MTGEEMVSGLESRDALEHNVKRNNGHIELEPITELNGISFDARAVLARIMGTLDAAEILIGSGDTERARALLRDAIARFNDALYGVEE